MISFWKLARFGCNSKVTTEQNTVNALRLVFSDKTKSERVTVWDCQTVTDSLKHKGFLELNNRFVVWKLFGFRNGTWTDLSTLGLRCQTLCFRTLKSEGATGTVSTPTSGPVTQQWISGNFEFSENASILVEDGMV